MATSETFRVGDRVASNENPMLGVGIVVAEENYGETLFVDWGNGKRFAHARGSLTAVAPPNYATVTVSRTADGGAVPDWERRADGWARADVVVVERIRSGAWDMTDVWGDWSTFTCPDAAREAADKALVAAGKLEASRAFVRLGEWVEDGVCHYRERNGTPWYHAYAVAQKAEVDAELVGKGLLDPSRAFKAHTDPKVIDGLCTPNTATRMQPRMYNSATALTAEQFNAPSDWSAKSVAKPAWGDWVPDERLSMAASPGMKPCFTRSKGEVYASAYDGHWTHDGIVRESATDIDDAREKADAFLVERGELEAERAFRRVGDWESAAGHWWHRFTNHAHEVIVNDTGWSTYRSWEQCLPLLLDFAPREFRDGFNRRQGKAWEAYVVALAGVKEQIQCSRYSGPAVLGDVVLLAADRARYALGPEWVKANVR